MWRGARKRKCIDTSDWGHKCHPWHLDGGHPWRAIHPWRVYYSWWLHCDELCQEGRESQYCHSSTRWDFEVNQHYLLRLSHHSRVSFCNRLKARMKRDPTKTPEDFKQQSNTVISNLQSSLFTVSCCTSTIPLARDINNKNQTSAHKAYNSSTREVAVGIVSIVKSIWSQVIPFTNELLYKHFEDLFLCNDLPSIGLNNSNTL